MNISVQSLTLEDLKTQAKRLRATLQSEGNIVTHSKSLELIASQYGYRDWNTLHAAIGNGPPTASVTLGQRVCGHYLGQKFVGEVLGVKMLGPDRYRLTLHFNEPVDVVTFGSFSAFRSRVSCTINARGITREKTSNGKPQLQLSL